jgi:amidohydrolase
MHIKGEKMKHRSVTAVFSVLVVLASYTPVFSQESSLEKQLIVKQIHKVIDADTKRLQDIFKDIHQNPELAFMETRTAEIVAKELRTLGFEVKTGIGKTGVVGILKNGEGPTLMFRADMDANAIEEATGLPYASKVRVTNLDGIETSVAHMCGHDAHTTWLIALAKAMSNMKDNWSGTLVLVAQPAEEPIEGAKAMLDDGFYTQHAVPKPDYFLAFHTGPFPTGTVILTSGRLNTGSEHIDVTFHGSGGHGSSPHHATDPVIMAGMAIVQFQTIVSRMIDPIEVGVLTIGSVQAGVDNNVIPTEATLKLKLHFSTPEIRERMVSRIKLISNNIARTYGIVSENMLPTIVHKGYAPAVVNSEAYMARIRKVLAEADAADKIINDARVIEGVAVHDLTIPGSDDAFALIENIDGVQGAYLGIGTAEPKVFEEARKNGKEFPFFVHEPNYVVDLNAIPFGAKVATLLALDVLGQQ